MLLGVPSSVAFWSVLSGLCASAFRRIYRWFRDSAIPFMLTTRMAFAGRESEKHAEECLESADLGQEECTVIFPARRFLPKTTITGPFAKVGENTYRLEDGFLCGPVSFGDVIEVDSTDQKNVLLFRRRVKRRGLKRKCYGISHRLVENPRFRQLCAGIEDSGGFAAVDFKGLFLVYLPRTSDIDVAAELERLERWERWTEDPAE